MLVLTKDDVQPVGCFVCHKAIVDDEQYVESTYDGPLNSVLSDIADAGIQIKQRTCMKCAKEE